MGRAHLFLLGEVGPHGLYAVPALDHIGLERYGAGPAVEFEKEAAGVAEDCARLVAAP